VRIGNNPLAGFLSEQQNTAPGYVLCADSFVPLVDMKKVVLQFLRTSDIKRRVVWTETANVNSDLRAFGLEMFDTTGTQLVHAEGAWPPALPRSAKGVFIIGLRLLAQDPTPSNSAATSASTAVRQTPSAQPAQTAQSASAHSIAFGEGGGGGAGGGAGGAGSASGATGASSIELT